MSAKSNDCGRAYEYAWITILAEALGRHRKLQIVANSAFEANKRSWMRMTDDMKRIYEISAKSAIETLLTPEPCMIENDEEPLISEFQRDRVGQSGDPRDILIKRGNIDWEIGLSVKHNHEAVKHSRLSHRLDFCNEWFGIPCSDLYWADAQPIFGRLKTEKEAGRKWSEIGDKETSVYMPLLAAFIDEVKRVDAVCPGIPRKMIEYLVGIKDYYKVVSFGSKRITIIQAFNIHASLNKPSKSKVSAISVPTAALPTELIALKFKAGSSNTAEMYLNNGWQLSF